MEYGLVHTSGHCVQNTDVHNTYFMPCTICVTNSLHIATWNDIPWSHNDGIITKSLIHDCVWQFDKGHPGSALYIGLSSQEPISAVKQRQGASNSP